MYKRQRFELPGTSEEVQLFLLPLRGRDGTMYGLCGFEISESYFKQNFAQPTGFDRLSCLLAPAGDGLAADAALSSGTTDGYYHTLRNTLVLRSMGGGLTQLTGPDSAYAGISQLCRLSESQSYRLAVCIPMADYRRLVFSGNLQMLLIGLFLDASETAIMANAQSFIFWNSVFYIPLAVLIIYRYTIQGLGFSGLAMFAGVAEMIARAMVGFWFVPLWGYFAACIASPVAWFFACFFLIPAYFVVRKRLQKEKDIEKEHDARTANA